MTAMLAEPPRPRPVLDLIDGDLPDDDLSPDELGSRIVGLAGRLAAATCRWLLLVARFDTTESFRAFGLSSTARWLSYSCGLSHRTAVEHVRVARALVAYPDLVAEMSSGRMSYAQVRAVSRVAGEDEPGVVSDLINIARHSTASQLETVVRGLRAVERNEAGTTPDEYVSMSWSAQSQWRCLARLDPERGAVVAAALEQIARAHDISQADALVRLAEIGLAALADSAKPPRPLRGHERSAVVIHVDAADVPAPREEPRSAEREAGTPPTGRSRVYAHIAGGPGLPGDVVERLLCEGRVRTVLRGEGGEVLDVGRSRRTVTERQYRALLTRHDGHCSHPGCTSTWGLEAHHVRHWIHGGRTDMANLVLLCKAHHLGHHAGEFRIEAVGRGRFEFVRHDDRLLEPHVDPGRLDDRRARLEAEYAEVAIDAARSRWRGERLDRDYAIAVLAQRRSRRRS